MAAQHKGCQACALSDIEYTHALGRVELVAGQAQEIDITLRQLDRNLAHGLNCICMKHTTPSRHALGDLFNGEDHTSFIVGVHHSDQGRVFVQLGIQFVQVQLSLAIHTEFYHSIPTILQFATHSQHSGMLHARGDDLSLVGIRRQRALNGRIITLCATACKDDLTGIASQQACNTFASLLNLDANLAAKHVHTGRVAILITKVGFDLFKDFVSHACCGIVVQIDGRNGLHDVS